MITVNWQHIILDPATYSRYGTHRVARVRMRGGAFPIANFGVWGDERETWSPNTPAKGIAPSVYSFTGNNFNFGFWSIVARNSSGIVRYATVIPIREPPITHNFGSESVTVEAKAWYVYDLGTGPGDHGAYLDAFDISSGDYIADDFVDVAPTSSFTTEANNGFLRSDDIKQEIITARDPTGDYTDVQYSFQNWEPLGGLTSSGGGGAEPIVDGRRITLHQSNIIVAIAFYNRLPSPRIREVPIIPFNWGILIGNLADGGYIIIRPGGLPPIPVGPWDPTILKQLSVMLQRIDRDIGRFGGFY